MMDNKIFGLIFLLVFTHREVFSIEQSQTVTVATLLKTETTWDGQAIVYPQGKPEVTSLLVEIAPGAETGWHSHPIPSYGMVLQGELEVQLRNGAVKRIKSGEVLAEVVNTSHNGRNVGNVPVKIVVFYLGTVGQKLSVKAEPLP
jgi:quercetin dioxygenase-like cupin family protein